MKDIKLAKFILKDEGLTCVLCKDGMVFRSDKRGVRPLLDLLESGIDFGGFSAADKVVGNGAAHLYVLLGVSEVYAEVISMPAVKTLCKHRINIRVGTLVEAISNRQGDGICPMEEAVRGIDDPKEALKAIRMKLAELSNQ